MSAVGPHQHRRADPWLTLPKFIAALADLARYVARMLDRQPEPQGERGCCGPCAIMIGYALLPSRPIR